MANRHAQNFVYAENPDPKHCKKCKFCKQLIDKKARVCPFCHRTVADGCSGIALAVFVFLIFLFVVFFFAN